MPADTPHRIELNLRTVSQLFNSMDPSPFHDKDLDRDADEFIVSWAAEYPVDEPVTLRIHLEQWPQDDPTPMIQAAVRNYFSYRAKLTALELHRLLRQGRASLITGLLFLFACLTAVRVASAGKSAWTAYLREGLTIAGWVAMWRPMQIYLYDWWPIRRRRQNFTRLASMDVEVVPKAAG